MAPTIVLWRHGQTDYNAEGRFQGQADVPLNDIGRAQARAAAEALAGFGIDRIVSSDLARAHETAMTLSARIGVEVEKDPLLREISVGRWEGLTRDEIAQQDPDQMAAWLSGVDMRPPGGESRKEAAVRVVSAIRTIVARSTDAETIAIVAHGAVLRGAAEELLGLNHEDAGFLGVMVNCGYGVLAPRRDTWVLRSWGIGPVLPADDAGVTPPA